jgi:hypothetical protein
MSTTRSIFIAVVLMAPTLVLAAPSLQGSWASPVGTIRIEQTDTTITGTVTEANGPCEYAAGTKVLEGAVLEDNLTGKLQMCFKGDSCKQKPWTFVVLLIAEQGQLLSGATHVRKGCSLPGQGTRGGIQFRRVPEPTADKPAEPPKPPAGTEYDPNSSTYDPRAWADKRKRADVLLSDGFNFLQEGYFERARERFLQAIELDPRRVEAYNGVGVTYYARHRYDDALTWYKRSLRYDPDFGDAYYNTACIYALQNKPEMALRYLQIAMLNGFVEVDAMMEDPDLKGLHDNPVFQRLIKPFVKPDEGEQAAEPTK